MSVIWNKGQLEAKTSGEFDGQLGESERAMEVDPKGVVALTKAEEQQGRASVY